MGMLKEAGEMVLEAAAGALLGPACESFLGSIEKYATVDMSVYDRVESMVENLELCIPKIEDHIMTLDGRQDKLKELKNEMIWGRSLLNKMKEGNELTLFRRNHYNDQLDELDRSLKKMARDLRLQLTALVLVSTNENTKVAYGNKRKLDEVDESVKAGFKRQEVLLENLINKIERNERPNQVGPLIEEGLEAALTKLSDRIVIPSFYSVQDTFMFQRIRSLPDKILGLRRTMLFECFSDNGMTERLNMSANEVQQQIMSVENGVNLFRNCTQVVEWTDDLKAKYRDEFRDLEKKLDALYNRLAGIQRLRSNCRRCHEAYGTTSTLVQGYVGLCQ